MQPCQVFGVLWPVLFTCRHGFQFPFIYSKYCITQFKKHKFTWSIIIRQYIHCIRWSLISMKWKNLLCFPHNHTMHIIWLQTFGMIVFYFFNWPWNYYYSVQRKITNKLFIVTPIQYNLFRNISFSSVLYQIYRKTILTQWILPWPKWDICTYRNTPVPTKAMHCWASLKHFG